MRVCGVRDSTFTTWVTSSSPRVFFRIGFQRYAATADEVTELARQLVEAAEALREGREFNVHQRVMDGFVAGRLGAREESSDAR
jgi:hypothetical protein